jgi:hypothetical protein
MSAFDEVVAEVGQLRISLQARVSVVIQKAIVNAVKNTVRTIRTPPIGFSNESEPRGLWWTINAERAVEELALLVEFGEENGVVL